MTYHEPITTPVEQNPWRFRIKEFELLEESGAFADYVRAELLKGEIWVVNAVHSRHAAVQAEVQGRLWSALRAMGSPLRTYVTPTINVENDSRVEPDLAVAERNDGGRLPASKVKLAIEVSDTTLRTDLGVKKGIYATACIPEYWVFDVNGCVIHRMWSPVDGDYAHQQEVSFGQPLSATAVDGLMIETDDL